MRIYVCDRCQKHFDSWSTIAVEIPGKALFDRKINVELCEDCIITLRTMVKDFLKKFMSITPIFLWYDFWVGFYWDRKGKCLYLFPVPMLGLKIQ